MVDSSSSPNRWLSVIAGIIAILFGIYALAMPGVTLASLLFVFAIFAIIEGILLLFGGIAAGGGSGNLRWLLVGAAVVTLILGVLALWNPVGFVLTVTILVGIWAFVLGLFQIFAGIADRSAPYWWLTLIAGIIGVIAGLYIMTNPVAGAVALVWVLGIYAIIFGIERIVVAFSPGPSAGAAAL
ncbi:MAG: HdeD family acid-resistance protein [Methanospirillum sp.]|nr:HdeD family acid-resistance protein [Methanospirillum sp.]